MGFKSTACAYEEDALPTEPKEDQLAGAKKKIQGQLASLTRPDKQANRFSMQVRVCTCTLHAHAILACEFAPCMHENS